MRVVLLNNDANETWAIDEAKITGTLTTTPAITLSTNSLNLGSTFTDSASAPISYTVSGTNLGSTNIAITPNSSLVEVSTNSSSGFSTNAINLTQNAGVVASTTIFARIAASSTATNNFSASISHVSGSASTNLAVSGMINQAGQVPVIIATNFTGQVGAAFSQTIPASGSPTNFALVSGTLPGGLTFNSNNGTITGTPTNAVTNSITVTADNVTGTSSNATIGFEITKGNQTITFAVLPAKVVGDAPFSISATASSGLAVSYASSNTNVATVSGNSVTVVGSGTTTITASQAGNENWNAATDATQTLLVYPSGVAYWNFNTDTPTVTPSGWTIGALAFGNNNGTNTMLGSSSVSSGYTNSFGLAASGSANASVAARTGILNTNASGSAYFEITVTAPVSSSNLAITNFSFGHRATSTGPAAYALRSSTDNYAADLASGTLSTNSTWVLVSKALSVPMTNGASATFRLYGYNGTGTAGVSTANWRIDDLTLGIGEFSLTTPSLNVLPDSLSGLSAFNGIPSAGSPYTIKGSNLTNDVTVTTSGTDLQISSDNSVFTNELTVKPAGGTVTNTTLYVRISASAAQGALSGALVRHVSSGLTNDLTVAGNVYDATRGVSSNSLVGWDARGETSYGVSPWYPTVSASNLIVSNGLTRGSGVLTSGTAAARGWGGVDWSSPDAATAVSSNKFVSFTIAATNGYKLSLSGISKMNYRRSSSGPASGVVQVQIGSGSFSDVAALTYPGTNSAGDSLAAAIDLSTNPTLQNVPANTSVTFRIVNFGGTNTTGTWYIYDKDSNPNVDFEVTGSVEVQTAVAPTITSTNAFTGTVGVAFSNNITATGDAPIVFSGTGLPSGLSVASSGAITGTPTAAGTFTNAILTATNAAGTNNQAVTFTIAPPPDSSFSGWRGSNLPSADLLLQYAYGASNSSTAVSPSNYPSTTFNSSSLVMTYYVRKNATNSNLVTPQVHTNLADSNWGSVPSSNIATLGTNNVNGVDVIKKTATVPIDGTNRKFLRLKISE